MTDLRSKQVQEIRALREQIQQETGKTPEQLYEEREKRIRDAIFLKQPDRVPLFIFGNPRTYAKLDNAAAYYKPAAWRKALIKDVVNLEPDMAGGSFSTAGETLTLLDVKNKKWPGGTLPSDYEYQAIEGEWMKADEYDMFFNDPSDFVIRYYLPRVYGSLAPLGKLPPVNLMMHGFEAMVDMFSTPEFKQLAKTIEKAGRELRKFRVAMGNLQEDMVSLGFPPFSYGGGAGIAPFDFLSSFLRGMSGSMLDIYRQPDKVIKACEVILERNLARAMPANPNTRGNPKRVFIPLWRGDKSFMSQKHFETFYWPTLKKAMMADIELGYVPNPVFEAHFGDRLKCMLELPKGKAVASVEHMDAVQAKEILGGHTCIIASVPKSLRYATTDEALAYYKDLIKNCGKGGGLMIMVALPNNISAREQKTMVKKLKEYATY
ncbi:MAG: hypothetical protein JW762_16590 [Dehalococcoidales bacterium]|nr:hypothetical protein [Dehalococcoidales bacterium]